MKAILDELLEKLPEEFNMMELHAKAEEKTPYILVALQECERMNSLIGEIRRSLKELDLGLKVREERQLSEYSRVVAIREATWSLQGFWMSSTIETTRKQLSVLILLAVAQCYLMTCCFVI